MKKTMIGTALAILAFAPISYGYTPYAEIESVSYAGSGCPAGSLDVDTWARFDTIAIYFDSFTAEAGRGVSFAESRKNCMINLGIEPPYGWTYQIEEVSFQGSADLERGVKALAKSSLYFQGQRQTASVSDTLYGSTYGRDYFSVDADVRRLGLHAPCGATRSLNINAQVRVDNLRNRSADGLVSMDEPLVLKIKWSRCR